MSATHPSWTDQDEAALFDDSLWPETLGWPSEQREAVIDWRRRFRSVARQRQAVVARWQRRAAERAAPENFVSPEGFAAGVDSIPRHQALLYAEAMLDTLKDAYEWLKLFEELAQEFDALAGGLPPVVGAPVNLVADCAGAILLLAEMSKNLEKTLNPKE